MTITYTDAYGPVIDSGVAVAPTARANTEIEQHLPNEIDTGTKNAVAVTAASHVPHRAVASPR